MSRHLGARRLSWLEACTQPQATCLHIRFHSQLQRPHAALHHQSVVGGGLGRYIRFSPIHSSLARPQNHSAAQ